MNIKKSSLDTWIQLLGMLSVLAGLLFVGLEMWQTQRIALATETSNRMYQVVEEIYTTAEIGLDWTKVVKNPLLLLDATEDKLVNSQLNKDLLGQSSLVTIKSINSQHEIMMENDEIRKEAWEAIDNFLKTES